MALPVLFYAIDLWQQEVELLGQEFGPLYRGTGRCPDDPRVAHHAAHCQLLARELRELPDRSGQGMLTAAVQKLFQLDKPDLIETGQEN